MLGRIPDLQLVDGHPKRNFIRSAINVEIRLAYYDRIMKTLPEQYHAPDAGVTPDQAPGPEFDYDDPCMPTFRILFLFRTEIDNSFQ